MPASVWLSLDSSLVVGSIFNRSIPPFQTSELFFLKQTSSCPYYLKNPGVGLLHGLDSQILADFGSHSLLPFSPERYKLKGKVCRSFCLSLSPPSLFSGLGA